jgi:hypothetical protein
MAGETVKLPFELQSGESVVLLCRRHVVFLISKMAGVVLAALLPIAALLLIVYLVNDGLDGTAGKIAGAISIAWALFWLVRGYFTWYRYQNDIWVVSNQRIVDSTKRHWFHHRMASADLVNVEDMSVHRSGMLPTIFNFGDLRCQTAGAQGNFVLSGIPNPTKVLGIVDAHRDTARRELGAFGRAQA